MGKGLSKKPNQVVLDEAQIERITGRLGSADQNAFSQIQSTLAAHLGSPEAARLWLITKAPEFGKSPLDVIADGRAKLVLAVLESRWGPNPTYA
jgi:hypothetical protein